MKFMVLLLIAIYWLMAFFMLLPAKPHNNIILENTLPKDKLKDPQVIDVTKQYRTRIRQIALVSSLFTLLLGLVPYESLFFIGFFVLIFGNIAAGYFCEIQFIRKMRAVIVKKHWELETEPILVDTKLLEEKNRKMVPFGWMVGNLILTVVCSILIFRSFGFIFIAFLFCGIGWLLWGVFAVSYYFITRLPVKAWSQDKGLNQRYNDITKYYWSLSMVVMSYVFAPITILPVLITASPNVSLIGNVSFFLLMIFGCVFSIGCLFTLRRKQDELMNQSSEQRYVGDDQYWRYAFYYNPNDTRLMLQDRIGMNITINLARPAAKVIAAILGIIVLGVMLMASIPMFNYDFNQNAFRLDVEESTVTMQAPMVKTSEISISDIEKVELVDEISGRAVRVNGMGTDNYATGSFRVNGKAATLYVNLKVQPILYISTDDEDYYFTSNQGEKTEKYYREILKLVGE